MNFKTSAALLSAAIAVSSCVAPGPSQQTSMAPSLSRGPAVDGRWIDRNGIVSLRNQYDVAGAQHAVARQLRPRLPVTIELHDGHKQPVLAHASGLIISPIQ